MSLKEEAREAFDFGTTLAKIVRRYRKDKKEKRAFNNFVKNIARFTGLDESSAKTLALKVQASNQNTYTLCEAQRKPTKYVRSKNFRNAIRRLGD